MDVDWIVANRRDNCLKVWKLIYLGLSLPPIEAVLPVLGQSLDISKRRSIHPLVAAFKLVGEVGCREFGLKFFQSLIRDTESE